MFFDTTTQKGISTLSPAETFSTLIPPRNFIIIITTELNSYTNDNTVTVSNTPFIPPFSTPTTGLRTRELHGPEYYHVGSPADPGYAESMRAMFG